MQAMAERLFRTIGRPELIDDPRFRTNTDRVRNNHELDPIVGAYMAERTQEECLEIFEKAGVTVGAVADVAQLAEHPYPLDRSVIVSLPDADTGWLAVPDVIPLLSEPPVRLRRAGPHPAA